MKADRDVPAELALVAMVADMVALLARQHRRRFYWPQIGFVINLSFANQQVVLVAGIIDVDSFGEHQPIVAKRFRATYLIGLDGSNSHVHDAHLSVRADAYLHAGGWSSLLTGEDHAFGADFQASMQRRFRAVA